MNYRRLDFEHKQRDKEAARQAAPTAWEAQQAAGGSGALFYRGVLHAYAASTALAAEHTRKKTPHLSAQRRRKKKISASESRRTGVAAVRAACALSAAALRLSRAARGYTGDGTFLATAKRR